MKKIILASFVFFSFLMHSQQRPKLVVGIIVDQMKMEYLYRFSNDFSENGFKKLINQGFSYKNTHFNYMPTFTGPGHASVYTGTTPAHHGIIGNNWYDRKTSKSVYCTDDVSVTLIGDGKAEEGLMSPKNLVATTITDELRLATNFKGKVFGISVKDRGAILPAGHFANGAFWMSETGAFVSSSFYGSQLPSWVTKFNSEKVFLPYLSKKWELLKPLAAYNESLADNNPYEGLLYGSKEPIFPYDLKAMFEKKGASVLRNTPFGNDYLADFAKKTIESESLGKDEVTDFLALSFSSTDYVGHLFGPRSQELQDTYLRLDETIASFILYLDTNVGKGNYLIFLTADHAGAENIDFLKDNKYPAESIDAKKLVSDLKSFSVSTFGDDLISEYSNFNVFYNKEKIKEKKIDINIVDIAFKEFLQSQNFVKRVFSVQDIQNGSSNDSYLNLVANGFDFSQSGDLVFVTKPGFMEYSGKGTSHGSPFTYDTHVPLIFYGWQINKGQSYEPKEITQIAPTLAHKLSISLPNCSDVRVLTEVLK